MNKRLNVRDISWFQIFLWEYYYMEIMILIIAVL